MTPSLVVRNRHTERCGAGASEPSRQNQSEAHAKSQSPNLKKNHLRNARFQSPPCPSAPLHTPCNTHSGNRVPSDRDTERERGIPPGRKRGTPKRDPRDRPTEGGRWRGGDRGEVGCAQQRRRARRIARYPPPGPRGSRARGWRRPAGAPAPAGTEWGPRRGPPSRRARRAPAAASRGARRPCEPRLVRL